ncbi:restriction endonuclease subunit S [Enterococcus lactis]|uniref:restriction endonuclease subunit S n=1 Tax=Enterococcus lactis TaxID=357441 RepID=UPI0024128ECB|nr:restriction endonuclease subunit S [Enterococcus lactis]EMF0551431.1 restriction endonuclease subunit S [Enterococcus faecium]MDV4987955.1 restriction endonuclease subunit S [Enterococcus faecium]
MQEERTNVPKIRFKGYAEDWEQRKLGDSIKVMDGDRGSNYPHESDFIENGDTLFLDTGNVTKTGFKFDSVKYITKEKDEQLRAGKLEKNDLVLTSRGTLGNIGFYDELIYKLHPKVRINSAMLILRNTDEQLSYSYLHTLLKGRLISDFMRKNQVGSAQPHITKSEFLKLNLNVPYDIEEQKKIGTFFKQLDDTIALHQRKLDLLKETKKGFLQKMFPKNGAKVPEIRFPGFTEDWEQRKLGEMVKQFSIKSKKEDEYTVLSSTNSGMEIRDGRVSGTSNLGYKIVEDGDLVLSPQNLWLGNININDIGKGLVSPSYKTFKFTNINSAFLKPQLHTSKMLEEYKNSSTQGASIVRRNLELDSFYQIPMLVPTTEEQSKLGVFFESMDNTITLHQRELDSLKEMKKSLLQQMFV